MTPEALAARILGPDVLDGLRAREEVRRLDLGEAVLPLLLDGQSAVSSQFLLRDVASPRALIARLAESPRYSPDWMEIYNAAIGIPLDELTPLLARSARSSGAWSPPPRDAQVRGRCSSQTRPGPFSSRGTVFRMLRPMIPHS